MINSYFSEHPGLLARIETIVGTSKASNISVYCINIYGDTATVRVYIKFQMPFKPRYLHSDEANDVLIFDLDIHNFKLAVNPAQKTSVPSKSLTAITEETLTVSLGNYVYNFTCPKIRFLNFRKDNHEDLIDSNQYI